MQVEPKETADPASARNRLFGRTPERDSAHRVFTWDVVPIPQLVTGASSCGVSEDRKRAIDALLEALSGSPAGTHGVVKSATVDLFGGMSYRYGSLVAVAECDATESVTVWTR